MCSYLGYQVLEPKPDNDNGIDLEISPVRIDSEWKCMPRIDVQLKATSTSKKTDKYLKFRIDLKTYKKLQAKCVQDRSFIFILELSNNTSEWVSYNGSGLMLSKTMYWYNPSRGVMPKSNRNSITLSIPLKNVLNTSSLHEILHKISMGEIVENEI